MATWSSRGLRGSTLEDMINRTNEKYRENGLALIQKVPTPITPVQIDQKSRHITLAYFDQKSTVDYIGAVQGIPVCFDAKETQNKSMPHANIHEHQIKHLDTISKMGGIGFLIVRFVKLEETYILTNDKLQSFLKNNTRKSIPLEYFKKEGFKLELKFNPRLNYINIINRILEGELHE